MPLRDTISSDWTTLKATLLSKGLTHLLQYTEDSVRYVIWTYDQTLAYSCVIWLGVVPDSVIVHGYTQAQNDADKADFETNYKSNSNQPLGPTSTIAGTSVPALVTLGMAVGDVLLASTGMAAVRRTAYTEPTANAQRSLASSSANDTAAGTGARKVQITYLTDTFEGPYTEIVTLDGTTGVNTLSSDICYIEKLRVIEVGSNAYPVGTITLYAGPDKTDGTIWTINPSNNQAFGCHHYVPAGKTCFITGAAAGGSSSTSSNGALFYLIMRNLALANSTEYAINDHFHAHGDTLVRPYSTPLCVVGPARIVGVTRPDTSNSITYRLAFEYYERAT